MKQNVLSPKGLNWVQHWVSRLGLLNVATSLLWSGVTLLLYDWLKNLTSPTFTCFKLRSQHQKPFLLCCQSLWQLVINPHLLCSQHGWDRKNPNRCFIWLLKHPTHHSIPSKLNIGRTAIVVDDLKARILFKANKLDQLIIPEESGWLLSLCHSTDKMLLAAAVQLVLISMEWIFMRYSLNQIKT